MRRDGWGGSGGAALARGRCGAHTHAVSTKRCLPRTLGHKLERTHTPMPHAPERAFLLPSAHCNTSLPPPPPRVPYTQVAAAATTTALPVLLLFPPPFP